MSVYVILLDTMAVSDDCGRAFIDKMRRLQNQIKDAKHARIVYEMEMHEEDYDEESECQLKCISGEILQLEMLYKSEAIDVKSFQKIKLA